MRHISMGSRRGDVTIHSLSRLAMALLVMAFALFALQRMLTTGNAVFILVGWILAPTILFLMLLNFDRFLPFWLMLIIFPVQVPVGGAFIPLNTLVGTCLVAVAILRHAIRADVLTRTTFPWQLRLILLALILAFLHNPALPTSGMYQQSDIGSGFRRYLIEAVKWSSIVYILYYVQNMKSEERLMAFIRTATWCGVFLKIAVLLTRSRFLYYLIGEDLDTLMFTGYLSRFFFVTAAVAGGLHVTLCWRPRTAPNRILRAMLVPICFIALGSGGTRSDILQGVLLISTYLLLQRKFATIGFFATSLAAALAIFMFVPSVRERVPERYQRIFIYSRQAASLTHVDRSMAQSAMGSVDWRMAIARMGLKDIVKTPIVGNGVRSAPVLSFRCTPEEIYRRQVNFVATHNFYVDQLLIFGIPAAVVLFVWLIRIFFTGLRITWQDPKRNAHSLLGYSTMIIPVIMVLGLFSSAAHQDQIVLVAIAAGCIQRRLKLDETSQPETSPQQLTAPDDTIGR
jgi:O-antigen ligase